MQKGEKQAPIRLIITVEREGGTGKGKQPLRRVPTLKKLTLKENADQMQKPHCTCTAMPCGPRTCGVLAHR